MDSLDLEEEADSNMSNSLPLSSQLKLCSDMMACEDDMMDDFLENGMEPSKEVSSSPPKEAQEDALALLGVSVYDHTQLEEQVMEQVKEQEQKRRMEDASKELRAVEEDIRFVKQRLCHIEKAIALAPKDPNQLTSMAKRELSAIKIERENKLKHLKKIEAKRKALQVCISGSTDEVSSSLQGGATADDELDEEVLSHLRHVFTAKETEEERLIRTGEMTPFGSVHSKPKQRSISIPQEPTDFDKFLLTEEETHLQAKKAASKSPKKQPPAPKVNRIVVKNDKDTNFHFTEMRAAPSKKRSRAQLLRIQKGSCPEVSPKKKKSRQLVVNYRSDSEVSEHGEEEEENVEYSDEDVYIPDKETTDEEEYTHEAKRNKKSGKKSGNTSDGCFSETESRKNKPVKSKTKKLVDDGDQAHFIKRIKEFEMLKLKEKHRKILESDSVVDSDEEDMTELEEGFKIPNSIWDKLYKYQQTCVHWLWELHRQNCGGIVGDEMGLGKTIQVIAFLVGLNCSNQRTDGDYFRGLGPVMLVCPTTVMHQWVKEFHTWWPPFRVAILHDSGSFVGKKDLLISTINKKHGILITSYAGVVRHQDSLLAYEWHYVVLDEGHKIRNPDAQATIAVKRFRTCHRLILSGSPVQNNLKELWSLFDFIFPGKLGTLPVFMQQFSVPIVLGGYANASQIQVQTAYKCATVLRDAIKPYLLRRMKSDVKMNINLPNKSEQVLFCQLTEEQISLYKGYINSKEVGSILDARLQVFVGLVNLRKICNHPDLFDGGPKIFKDTDITQLSEEEKFGFPGRSGKMRVVEALLHLWHKQGHRVLLFTQSRQMMDILELFVKNKNYSYMKMDGSTPISSRQPAINKFNSDPSVFVFLLTTRVGGLGVNLTGADRVILYDPDWNPSTDAQARERAWRIGQKRQVTVYRLLTAGTIEEKIYHRQIFKQFVTNRVLKDPRQRRFFKSNDLFELFTYNELGTQGTETSAIFAGTGSEVRPKKNVRKTKQSPKDSEEEPSKGSEKGVKEVTFSEEKREQMKLLAKKLSMELTGKVGENSEPKKASCTSMNKTRERPSDETALGKDAFKNKEKKNSQRKSSKDGTSKKHKKKRAAEVEGEKIEGVVKKSVYKPPQDDEEKNQKEDDYVLSKLFKTSGVHTALKHDTIVDSSAPDYMIVEGEAQRVANEAVKALRASREQCRRAEEGVPTWTGTRGPRFGQRKRLPPGSLSTAFESQLPKTHKKLKFDGRHCMDNGGASSSNDLLAAIQRRKVVFGTDQDDAQTTAPPSTEHDSLLADILSFVAFQAAEDGRATTREILARFKDKVPPKKSAIFKAMLKKICNFSRTSEGEGQWRLKEEFR